MAYSVVNNKEEARKQLEELINAFQKQHNIYTKRSYSEAQLRIDFLNPILKTFGWDVDNEEQKSQFLRDIIQEEAIEPILSGGQDIIISASTASGKTEAFFLPACSAIAENTEGFGIRANSRRL